MKLSSTLIYFLLLFSISLFLFKTIFYSLGIVLIFLVGSTLIETALRHRQSPLFLLIIKPLVSLFLSAGLSVSFYCILFLPTEFLLTEVLYKISEIHRYIGTFFIIFLTILFGLTKWQRLIKTRKTYLIILFFYFFSGLVYLSYRKEKLSREYLPKIYRFSPEWGIQQVEVKIEGVNFGPVWKKGKVAFNGDRMNIISWEERKIVAEVPVPNKFGWVFLSVVRGDGIVSNKVPFEIRNPDNLLNGLEK